MTPDQQLKNDLQRAFMPLVAYMEQPQRFSFHSQQMTEDGSANTIMFENDDGDVLFVTIPLNGATPSVMLHRG